MKCSLTLKCIGRVDKISNTSKQVFEMQAIKNKFLSCALASFTQHSMRGISVLASFLHLVSAAGLYMIM